jgi:hypothetical protein
MLYIFISIWTLAGTSLLYQHYHTYS